MAPKHKTGKRYTEGVQNYNVNLVPNFEVQKRATLERIAASGAQGLLDSQAAEQRMEDEKEAAREATYQQGAAIYGSAAGADVLSAERERLLGGFAEAQAMAGGAHDQYMDRLAGSSVAYNEMAQDSARINKDRMDKSITQLKLEYDFAREMLANRGGSGGGGGPGGPGGDPFNPNEVDPNAGANESTINRLIRVGIGMSYDKDVLTMGTEDATAKADAQRDLMLANEDLFLEQHQYANAADYYGANEDGAAATAYLAFRDSGMSETEAQLSLDVLGYNIRGQTYGRQTITGPFGRQVPGAIPFRQAGVMYRSNVQPDLGYDPGLLNNLQIATPSTPNGPNTYPPQRWTPGRNVTSRRPGGTRAAQVAQAQEPVFQGWVGTNGGNNDAWGM